jgi:hypothetical protein
VGSSGEVSIGRRVEVKEQRTVCASGVCASGVCASGVVTGGVCARGACVCGVGLVLVEDVLDLGLDLFHSSSHCDCCLY